MNILRKKELFLVIVMYLISIFYFKILYFLFKDVFIIITSDQVFAQEFLINSIFVVFTFVGAVITWFVLSRAFPNIKGDLKAFIMIILIVCTSISLVKFNPVIIHKVNPHFIYVSDTSDDIHKYDKEYIYFDWDEIPTRGYTAYKLNKSVVIMYTKPIGWHRTISKFIFYFRLYPTKKDLTIYLGTSHGDDSTKTYLQQNVDIFMYENKNVYEQIWDGEKFDNTKLVNFNKKANLNFEKMKQKGIYFDMLQLQNLNY